MTNISAATSKLEALIGSADNILVVSHVSPDPDSICSILLLGTTLEANYPEKKITMFSEELPDNLDYLDSFTEIKSGSLKEFLNNEQPKLIIIVDAMNFERCSRHEDQEVSQMVKDKDIPLAIIDHHQQLDIEQNAAYINEMYPSAVQQVYEVCFNELRLEKPEGYAETTLTGLYSDTGGFIYLSDKHEQTLSLVSELLRQGLSVELIKNKLYQYSLDQMKIVAELANNLTQTNDYAFTNLSDEFVNNWNQDHSYQEMQTPTKIFTDSFIRNIKGNRWGFLVYKDTRQGEDVYAVSFRSLEGQPDVSDLASNLGGGGHKGAAGARLHANNVTEAIKIIQEIIVKYRG